MSDTLTALTQALGPKTGMRRIPFPLESYEHHSRPLSSKRLLNLMAEQQPTDARTEAALVPTAGLVLFDTLGTGPVSAMNGDNPGMIYAVSGSRFYRLVFAADGSHTTADLGDIGVPSGPSPHDQFVTIAVSPTAATVCVPPNAFVCDHFTPVNQLGGTFPGGASSVTYFDGYFVFTSQTNSQQFFISRLNDPSDFDALDFASADAFPNAFVRVLTLGTSLWFAGPHGFEIWYDSGDADFPFRRRLGGIIQRGIGTGRAVTIADESVFWVSSAAVVWRSVGYQAQRVSTPADEELIRSLGAFNIVSCTSYSQGGHILVAINWPDRTIVYDCATKKWHDRASAADGSGRWRVEAAADNNGIPVLGDCVTGQLYTAEPLVGTDNGVYIRRELVLPPLWAGTGRGFMSRVEIEMEVGGGFSPGAISLDWSDDGGITFRTPARTLQTGAYPETRKRVFTTRLGSFRQRVLRITAAGFATFYAVDADIHLETTPGAAAGAAS